MITLLLLVRATYMWCCSSRTSRSWWIAHSTQRQRRGCNKHPVGWITYVCVSVVGQVINHRLTLTWLFSAIFLWSCLSCPKRARWWSFSCQRKNIKSTGRTSRRWKLSRAARRKNDAPSRISLPSASQFQSWFRMSGAPEKITRTSRVSFDSVELAIGAGMPGSLDWFGWRRRLHCKSSTWIRQVWWNRSLVTWAESALRPSNRPCLIGLETWFTEAIDSYRLRAVNILSLPCFEIVDKNKMQTFDDCFSMWPFHCFLKSCVVPCGCKNHDSCCIFHL